jgi:uncharacterized protein YkwD
MRQIVIHCLIGLVVAIYATEPVSAYTLEPNYYSYFSQEINQYCSQDSAFSPHIISVIRVIQKKPTPSQSVIASASFTQKPTLTPPLTPNPTVTHTPQPDPPNSESSPTPSIEPTQKNENLEADNSSGLSAAKVLDLINAHRQTIGLEPYQTDQRLCSLAQSRSEELNNEIFGDAYVHQGFNERDLDYWITENMVHQPTEEAVLSWWLGSSLHRQAIESSIHTHSCGVCSGNTCAQLFTSWQPK